MLGQDEGLNSFKVKQAAYLLMMMELCNRKEIVRKYSLVPDYCPTPTYLTLTSKPTQQWANINIKAVRNIQSKCFAL